MSSFQFPQPVQPQAHQVAPNACPQPIYPGQPLPGPAFGPGGYGPPQRSGGVPPVWAVLGGLAAALLLVVGVVAGVRGSGGGEDGEGPDGSDPSSALLASNEEPGPGSQNEDPGEGEGPGTSGEAEDAALWLVGEVSDGELSCVAEELEDEGLVDATNADDVDDHAEELAAISVGCLSTDSWVDAHIVNIEYWYGYTLDSYTRDCVESGLGSLDRGDWEEIVTETLLGNDISYLVEPAYGYCFG